MCPNTRVFHFSEVMKQIFHYFQYEPPLKPPRGEVNAADAFDIGSFDEDDVKGIKVMFFFFYGNTAVLLRSRYYFCGFVASRKNISLQQPGYGMYAVTLLQCEPEFCQTD